MKVLYLHQYFNTPAMKGGTRSYEMAKRMVAKGHEVHIITSRRDPEDKPLSKKWVYEEIEGIHVHWLTVPYNNRMSYTQRIKAFFSFAVKSGKKAIEIGGDIIFATSTPLTIALPAVKAKRTLKIPMVFEVRDLWPELPIAIGALRSPITKLAAQHLERFAYRNSNHIVCLSPGMKAGVIKSGYPEEDISVIPNSCDLDLFCRSEEDIAVDSFRASREWLKGRPLILYAGTLGHINGVTWLAYVASAMLELDDNVRFLVVGDGVDHDKVKQTAKSLGVLNKNFFMEPAVPKKHMPQVFGAATIATSLFIPLEEMWANSANKFFDALASGKPVAINYGGWQASLVEEHEVGVVLPHDNVQASAKSLRSLISNSKRLLEQGANSRELAESSFSRDLLADKLIECLETNLEEFKRNA